MSAVRFTTSARRHKVGRARALHVLANAYVVVELPSTETSAVRQLHLGDDHTGRALEIVTVEAEDGATLVIPCHGSAREAPPAVPRAPAEGRGR